MNQQNSRSHLVNPGARQEIIPASSFNLNTELLEPWKPVSSFSQFVEIDSAMMKPLLMDVHGKAQLLLLVLSVNNEPFCNQFVNLHELALWLIQRRHQNL